MSACGTRLNKASARTRKYALVFVPILSKSIYLFGIYACAHAHTHTRPNTYLIVYKLLKMCYTHII